MYVYFTPTQFVDYSGLHIVIDESCRGFGDLLNPAKDAICSDIFNLKADKSLSDCIRKKMPKNCPLEPPVADVLGCVQGKCTGGDVLIVNCTDDPSHCKSSLGTLCADTPCSGSTPVKPFTQTYICTKNFFECKPGKPPTVNEGCSCPSESYGVKCPEQGKNLPPALCTILHEMLHTCGVCTSNSKPGKGGFGQGAPNKYPCSESYAEALACCIGARLGKK